MESEALVDTLPAREKRVEVRTVLNTLFEVGTKRLVVKLAERLSAVKAETVGYTLAKVKYQVVVNKLSAASRGRI